MSKSEILLMQRIALLEKEIESLRRIKCDFDEIIEHATEIIFKLDSTGSFYFVSAEFGRTLGYSNQEIQGKHFAFIVHPDDLQLCVETFETLKTYGKADGNKTFRVKHKNGHYKWVNCSAVCLYDEMNNPTHSIGFAHDITQLQAVVEDLQVSEKALRISEGQYRSLFEALGEGVVLLDSNGMVIASNRYAEKIFGVGKTEMMHLNRLDHKYYHEDGTDYPIHTHPSQFTLKSGKSLKDVVMGIEKKGCEMTWISINTEPIYYSENREKPDAVVASFIDITQAKKDKEEIQRNQKLYIEATKAVAQAVVDAQEKERAEIGYELHDNVNQILSTARVFLDLAKNDDGERLNLIAISSANIGNAVNEIRRISRSLVPASLNDLGLILSIEDLLESINITKAIKVEFYHSGNIETAISEKGKLMLFRIIQEQVTNILKHAEATHMIVELVVDSKTISLTITDNGKGFELEKVISKKGVGLHNIANRTELFNGRMNIVTSPANGCKLNIIIPL